MKDEYSQKNLRIYRGTPGRNREEARNRIAILLLDGIIEMVRGRRYSDALARALDDKREEVMDVVIDALRGEKFNELMESIMVDVLEEIREEIEKSS